MHHPPSRPHRASKRVPPPPSAFATPAAEVLAEPATADFAVEASPRLRQWLRTREISLALSTGENGKILTIGAGEAGFAVFEVGCDSPGALLQAEAGLYVAARERVWRFDDVLSEGESFHGADRLCLPGQCRATGAIAIQDLAAGENGRLLVAAARFNCVARMNSRGDLKPTWRPAFIDAGAREDRCHVTGFCLQDGSLAYVTIAAATNEKDGWRQQIAGGGQIIDVTTGKTVAAKLTMPRAPRLYRDRLWVLESGTGGFGWIDRAQRRFERVAQLPGYPRSLQFVGDHALITTERWRHEAAGAAGVHWVNIKTGKIDHSLTLTGSITAVHDVALIPGLTVPRLAGLSLADSGQRMAG